MDRLENTAGSGLVLLEAYLDHPTSNYRQFNSNENSQNDAPITPVSKEQHFQWIKLLLPVWLALEEVTGDRRYSLFELSKSLD